LLSGYIAMQYLLMYHFNLAIVVVVALLNQRQD